MTQTARARITIAEKIAARFSDGATFENARGENIAEIAGLAAEHFEHSGPQEHDDTVVRCVFSDASALLIGRVWGVETYRRPWESAGAETADVNARAPELGCLLHHAPTGTDVAVYVQADGTVTIVGDAHGPWAITLTCTHITGVNVMKLSEATALVTHINAKSTSDADGNIATARVVRILPRHIDPPTPNDDGWDVKVCVVPCITLAPETDDIRF